jgi:chorismate dehydratase
MRIGAVNYLNSNPLIEGLNQLAPRAELVLDYPIRLADRLAAGKLDVALVQSVEYLRGAGYEIVSDACVATCGPVLSVKLYGRVPWGQVRTLALDEGSRTSAALARIMLAERYGVQPELQLLPLGVAIEASRADAILMIGDRAIHPPREKFVATWDLGEEWFEWTGLPFVFAVWAARPGTKLGQIERALVQARDRGMARLEAIARREAPLLEIPEETAIGYLTRNLHFRLESPERNGLRLFHELACRQGLVPAPKRGLAPAGPSR